MAESISWPPEKQMDVVTVQFPTSVSQPVIHDEIAEYFGEFDFQVVARALGKLHAEEKLWQDPRGRACVRGSKFSARVPAVKE